VNGFEDSDGSIVVLTAEGRPLVEASSSWELVVASDDKGFETVNWQDRDGNLHDITQRLTGGKLGGWVIARDQYVEAYKEELDTFVKTLMDEINSIHRSGYGLTADPSTGMPYTGLDFFEGDGASDISVNQELKSDPGKIAAAKDKDAVFGDNRNALLISELRSKYVLNDGTSTFDSFYQALVSRVGSDVKQSQSFANHQKDMLEYLNGFRESVSGVSIDEEMMNILVQQRAYQASARVISIVDELLDNLLRI
jgi:flagellar hook-associated protein 1 FlgK